MRTKRELQEDLAVPMGVLLQADREKWSLVGEPRWSREFNSFGILVSSPHRSRWIERKIAILRKTFELTDDSAFNKVEFTYKGMKGFLLVLDSSEPFGFFDSVLSMPEHTVSLLRKVIKKNRKYVEKMIGSPAPKWPTFGYKFQGGNLFLTKAPKAVGKVYIPSSSVFLKMFECLPEVARYSYAILNKEAP